MITFSSYNQPSMNGAKEYLVWLKRHDDTVRCIGTAFKTNNGDWCANIDDNRGGVKTHIHRKFKHLKMSVRNGWLS